MTTTQLQLRRDTAANIAAITPAQGEPIYDVTNATLRVGDGATPGGLLLAGPYGFASWTPTLYGSSAAGAPTYTIQAGSYERIGRLIVCRFNAAISALGGMTGNLLIGGLPFNSANVASDLGGGALWIFNGIAFDAGYSFAGLEVPQNANFAEPVENGSNKTASLIAIVNLTLPVQLAGTFNYHL
jgi:hypothetical protein